MPKRWQLTTHGLGAGAGVLLLTFGLAACGPTGSPAATNSPNQARPAASPDAQQVPDLTNQGRATIENGSLKPDRFAGQIGDAFSLIVTGDGAEHTLAIAPLVADKTIAAQGETKVDFTISGEPGISQIIIDGKQAGEFERRAASGAAAD